MKKLKLLIATVLIAQLANGQIAFQKIFGGMFQDGGYSVLQTADSGYVFTGYWCYGPVYCVNKMFLIKTDALGNALWTKFLSTTESWGYSLIQTSDTGFAVAGFDIEYIPSITTEPYLAKTNAVGDTLWTKSYLGNIWLDYIYSLKQTSDGGFILAGHSDTIAGSTGDLLLIKTDANGIMQWDRTYGYGLSRPGYAHSVVEVNNGYVVLGFTTEANGSGNNDIYLFKTDYNGDTLWTKTYLAGNDDQGFCIQKTTDNGFIISGATLSFGAGSYDAYLIKADSNGVKLWQKTYGGLDNEYGNHVSLTNDGGYIIAGSTESFSVGGFDAYLVKTDSLGNEQWHKTFGGINPDYAYSVQQTFDGGYILVGMRGDNIYLVKTDGNGNVTSTNEINPSQLFPQMKIYPNPFSSETIIKSTQNLRDAVIDIYNSLGQEVKRIKNISGNEIKIQRGALSNGIYFIQLKQDNEIVGKDKLIITD